MKKLSSRLEIMVPTHVVNISSDPYIKNEMLPRTIESCHTTLKLEDVQFSICIEPRFWKEYPEIMLRKADGILTSEIWGPETRKTAKSPEEKECSQLEALLTAVGLFLVVFEI